MKLQFLRQSELDELYRTVPKNLERYRAGDFSELEADGSYYFESDIEVPEDWTAKMVMPAGKKDHDVENCELIYSALKLTPSQAREERLWTYLCHTSLLDYTRARWPIPDDNVAAVAHIQSHFFAKTKRQIERDNAGSRLWWLAHLCARVEERPLKESLTYLLHQSDVRANIVERPTLSRSAIVFCSILDLLAQSFSADKKLFVRDTFREFMKRLNDLGGYILLDALDRKGVKALLEDIVKGHLAPAKP